MFKIRSHPAVFSLFFTLLLAGCGWATGSTNQLLVINLLDPELYQDCHITGSVNVPFEQLENYAQKLSREREIIVYCS
ncbi:MAG TPA: rhodanese-like domain-containing protein, partial [Candidatus Babeliales bacterium]|nr:rhodanese-like domain-containing protein [Candidatus Babeliales bacterium]